MLSDWFGPLPSGSIIVNGMRWQGSDRVSSRPGDVTVPLRWLSPVRDQSMERALIAALAAQYWQGESPAKSFQDALNSYVATRATHHILEGSNFAAPRFFGGHVSFPLRSLLLSPPVADPRPRVWTFDEATGEELSRNLRAMQTLERLVGWPTLLQSIAAIRAAGPSHWTMAALGETLSTVTGADLLPVVQQCFSDDLGYSLDGMESRSVDGMMQTTLTISGKGPRWPTPLEIRFADGAIFRDAFDASAPLIYTSKAPAVAASIDPDAMLLVDRTRENNSIVRDAPTSPLGVRLALHWLAWLQNAMLSYTAVV